jgi:hypothetical protein
MTSVSNTTLINLRYESLTDTLAAADETPIDSNYFNFFFSQQSNGCGGCTLVDAAGDSVE